MAYHDVTLNYGKNGVTPKPDPIFVRKGQTISFKVGTGAPRGAKARITIRDGSSFSTAKFEEGDPDIEVVAGLAAETTYECDLVVDGKILKRPEGAAGGGMRPARD
jgi:hypothetical protein